MIFSRQIYLYLLTFLFLGACSNDLKEAAKVGSQLEILQKAGIEIASGFYNSCLNVKELSLDLGYLRNKKERVEAAEKACGKGETPEKNTGHLKFSSDVANNFRVLTLYISGLTSLTNAKKVDFKKPTDELFKSIESLNSSLEKTDIEKKPIPQEAITGGEKIFSAILDFFQRNYRTKQVKLAIVCVNKPFQDFSNGLINLVELSYIDGVLKTEENQLQLNYSSFEPSKDTPDISALILRNFQDDDFDDLENRKKRAVAFQKALKETTSTHNALQKEFRPDIDATDEQLRKTCEEYLTKDKKPEKNEKLSEIKIEDFDRDQLERLQIILLSYHNRMQPILDQLQQEDL